MLPAIRQWGYVYRFNGKRASPRCRSGACRIWDGTPDDRPTKPMCGLRSRHPEPVPPILHDGHDHRHDLIPTLAILLGEQRAPKVGLRTRGP